MAEDTCIHVPSSASSAAAPMCPSTLGRLEQRELEEQTFFRKLTLVMMSSFPLSRSEETISMARQWLRDSGPAVDSQAGGMCTADEPVQEGRQLFPESPVHPRSPCAQGRKARLEPTPVSRPALSHTELLINLSPAPAPKLLSV